MNGRFTTVQRHSSLSGRIDRVLRTLEDRPASALRDHKEACCVGAQAWFHAMARSASALEPGPPAWIRERWRWGPTNWPLYWCDAIRTSTLDCGALAALACAAFATEAGSVYRVQLVERFDETAVRNWNGVWPDKVRTLRWTWQDLTYHEVAAIEDAHHLIRIWDPTDNCWLEEKQADGYGSAVAARVLVHSGRSSPFRWREALLPPNLWVKIDG